MRRETKVLPLLLALGEPTVLPLKKKKLKTAQDPYTYTPRGETKILTPHLITPNGEATVLNPLK